MQQIALADAALDERGPARVVAGRRSTVVATPELETDPFRLAAATWSGARQTADVHMQIRTRDHTGWTHWTELPDDGHGPDPDSAEALGARSGTEPLIVDESDAVQVRVTTADGSVPEDLQLTLVEPSESSADDSIAASVPPRSPAGRPPILKRAEWGADESLREPGNPDYGVIRGAFVHHTAGTNSYDRDDVPAIIRGIYAYHVNGRGWRDIGYNFLVDKFGRTWEGRYGGAHLPVIGAHTANYNGSSVGVAVLGTYTSKVPESAVLTAYARVFAWKFGVNGVNPNGMVAYPGERTLPSISGHRAAAATDCPGEELALRLAEIRARTARLLEPVASTLRLGGPRSAPINSTPTFSVSWQIGDTKVSGLASLQRRLGDAWVGVRTIEVEAGTATFRTQLTRSTTYRLRVTAGRPPVLPTTSNLLPVVAS
jgi:hypothetical protein